MFDEARILIAEDDRRIARDLADSVEDAGGRVVGPVPTTAAALTLLETVPVDAAILDTALFDRDITPVALLLLSRNVPIIIYSGLGLPAALAERHPRVPLLMKPVPPSEVIMQLATLRNQRSDPIAEWKGPLEGAREENSIAFLATPVSVYGGSREGRSAFSNGTLVGILIPVTAEESGDGGPGGWFLEAGFGPCGVMTAATPPVFADLTEAAAWFKKMLARDG